MLIMLLGGAQSRQLELREQGWSEPALVLRGYSQYPPPALGFVRGVGTLLRCSWVLPNHEKLGGMHQEHRMSCGPPAHVRLRAEYTRGVSVTTT